MMLDISQKEESEVKQKVKLITLRNSCWEKNSTFMTFSKLFIFSLSSCHAWLLWSVEVVSLLPDGDLYGAKIKPLNSAVAWHLCFSSSAFLLDTIQSKLWRLSWNSTHQCIMDIEAWKVWFMVIYKQCQKKLIKHLYLTLRTFHNLVSQPKLLLKNQLKLYPRQPTRSKLLKSQNNMDGQVIMGDTMDITVTTMKDIMDMEITVIMAHQDITAAAVVQSFLPLFWLCMLVSLRRTRQPSETWRFWKEKTTMVMVSNGTGKRNAVQWTEEDQWVEDVDQWEVVDADQWEVVADHNKQLNQLLFNKYQLLYTQDQLKSLMFLSQLPSKLSKHLHQHQWSRNLHQLLVNQYLSTRYATNHHLLLLHHPTIWFEYLVSKYSKT